MSTKDREDRSSKIFIADINGPFAGKMIYSELPLHKDHVYERTETLYDNPVEHTAWAFCETCRVEFWYESVELVERNYAQNS